MTLKEWFRNQSLALAMAVSNVEKNMFGQEKKNLDEKASHEKRHSEGTLADDLMQGKLTQEVRDLRWRMYKIFKAMDDVQTIFSKDKKTYNITQKDRNFLLNKVKIDPFDSYELEMVFNNNEVPKGLIESINNPGVKQKEISGDTTSNIVRGGDYMATNKSESPLNVMRDVIVKFDIENYTKKLNVRKIDERKKLLEFYISKYPDEYNVNTKHFIREIKKVIDNGPRNINFLEIKEVGFITYKTFGVEDLLAYGYKILNFDKIIEFDGYYVIKFIAEVEINGVSIIEGFKEEELEKKYNKKAPRKRKV